MSRRILTKSSKSPASIANIHLTKYDVKDEVVQYKIGDSVTYPKFGNGIVEKINLRSGRVHLHIRFDDEVKCIDQKWLRRRKV